MTFTIITAVRNGAGTIANCLTSVREQRTSAEHIVVDGNSTDGTVDFVRAQARPGLTLISEPDNGIYDAMRKGLERAGGDVVGFLNADDFYADERVLSWVSEAFDDPGTASCYGDLLYVRPGQTEGNQTPPLERMDGEFQMPGEQIVRWWKAGQMTPNSFLWGWMPPHPTFFVRRAVYQKLGGFRMDMGTAADYELTLRFLVKHAIKTRYIERILVKMGVGGVSNATLRNRLMANRNDRLAWRVNDLRPYPWTLILKPLRKISQWIS